MPAFKIQRFFSLAALVLGIGSFPVHAITYNVTDAVENCSDSTHGLWTSTDYSSTGTCGQFFSISGTLEINTDDADTANWFAQLTATAINPQGLEADIDLRFDDWLDDHEYKREGGAIYDHAGNPTAIDFFDTVLGTIMIDGNTYDIDGFAGGYAFQYGLGANAKNPNVYGASAWIQSCTTTSDPNCGDMLAHHWDLNLNLTPVPLPAAAYLFGAALLGLVGLRKRQRKKALA